MTRRPGLRVEGLKELQKDLSKLQDIEGKRELKQANREAATEVKEAAIPQIPNRTGLSTGKIARTAAVRVGGRDAAVKFGGMRALHAPPIHWGWPSRNIERRQFIWRGYYRVVNSVDEKYRNAVDKIAKRVTARGAGR